MGYHSNFNPERKGERGFINQLYKELGPGACEGNDHNE